MRHGVSLLRAGLASARDIAAALGWDIKNYVRYGKRRPKKYQLAWCDPADIKLSTVYFIPVEDGYLRHGQQRDVASMRSKYRQFITAGDWDQNVVKIDDVSIIHRTKERFQQDVSWRAVGEIDWMMKNIRKFSIQDGCTNIEDVLQRCDQLDALFHSVARDEGLLPQRKLHRFAFREAGGIGVGIDRDGQLIWVKGGAHRLAMAQVLGLSKIPICLQIVHEDAVKSGLAFKVARKSMSDFAHRPSKGSPPHAGLSGS